MPFLFTILPCELIKWVSQKAFKVLLEWGEVYNDQNIWLPYELEGNSLAATLTLCYAGSVGSDAYISGTVGVNLLISERFQFSIHWET